MRLFGETDTGKQRHSNQDAFYYKDFGDNCAFAVVCDGMGGAACGNVASDIAVKCVAESVEKAFRPNLTASAAENILRSALYAANIAIYRAANSDPNMKGMGTTIVMLLVVNGLGYVLHVGDSRAYIFSGGELNQLTVDHSIVQTLVDSGKITAEEAKVHPRKNVITRALGVEKEVSPDLDFFSLSAGDAVLLCSDGLTNFVSSASIKDELAVIDDSIAKRMINLANDGGGGDNITVVIMTA